MWAEEIFSIKRSGPAYAHKTPNSDYPVPRQHVIMEEYLTLFYQLIHCFARFKFSIVEQSRSYPILWYHVAYVVNRRFGTTYLSHPSVNKPANCHFWNIT